MKALLALSVVLGLAALPAFADECVAPITDVKIPNGNKATMEEIVAANYALQESTTEVEAYRQCLKAEQQAKIVAIGPDITDDQKAKIASEYVNRQNAEEEKLQKLADRYNEAVRNYRTKQAEEEANEQAQQQAAAANAAEQAAKQKARQQAAAEKIDEGGSR